LILLIGQDLSMDFEPKRIAVIGNGGGGKSTLAAALSERYGLAWHEVDKIQFGPNWSRPPEDHVRAEINAIIEQPEWVIDGFGPYDTILRRFDIADLIVFIDHPLWVHYWWAMERQISAHQGQARFGGREDCDLRDVNREMCQAIWYVHTELRPKIVEDLKRFSAKVQTVGSPEKLNEHLKELTGKVPE